MMFAKVIAAVLDSHYCKKKPSIEQRNLEIIEFFRDSTYSPFSIHNIVIMNHEIYGSPQNMSYYGGEWFSPTKISKIFQR